MNTTISKSTIWRNNNKERFLATTRNWRRGYLKKIRLKIFAILGNQCLRCGFDDYRALQIDHVNGGGKKDQQKRGKGENYYLRILKDIENGNKDLYQTLCANCNFIKRNERKEWGEQKPTIIP